MDNQPLMPTSPTPFSTPTGGGGGAFLPVLVAILGLGAVVFAVLTLTFYSKANTATKTLNTQKAAAVAVAKAAQQKADQAAAVKANESPFRSYTAPVEDGSFEIKFPKDWSSLVDEERSGTRVNLSLNPDFVRRTNGQDNPLATRILFEETSAATAMNPFNSLISHNILTKKNITISGQAGFDITGKFSDKRTVREVIVPVRDKVLIFINEDAHYGTEFDSILAQSKIIP